MIIDLGQNNRRYGKIVFYIPEKGMRRKGRKIFAEGKYILMEEKKNGEGKGGKYLERENIFFGGEGKGGKYLEKENIFFEQKESKKIFGEGKCFLQKRR